jgi:UDP-N-acetyl-D-mannosaminuronate dehydrogenase/intein/homing endonuclease
LEKIERFEAQVGIIGLGYVGLPLAVISGRAGYRVVGVDVSQRAVETINAGHSHIGDIKDEEVAALVQAGRLRATCDYGVLKECDVIIICVPTPLDKNRDPDISYIVTAGEGIAANMRPGQLISLESTTYPGTTEEDLLPVLERSGFRVGEDFFLCFSPERVDPGSKKWNTRNTPKVVGGLTPACQEAAVAFYGRIVDRVIPVSSPGAAEMTKIFENTFRVVNMAVVNEMAMLCDRMGLSIWEIITAASTKPFGFMPFYPGPGVGGHCLDGQEFVFVKNGQGVEALALADCFERLASSPETVREDVPGGTLLTPPGMEILSFDKTGRSCLRPLTHLARRQYDGAMVRIETDDGRFLTVTDRHPMIVWEEGRAVVRLAQDLRAGDRLPVTGTPMAETEVRPLVIDLIPFVPASERRRVRARPAKGTYADFREELRPHLRRLCPQTYWDIFRQNTMSLDLYCTLEEMGAMPFRHSEVMLCTGRGPSWNSIPAVIRVDEDMARLIGYYLSEGCITEDESLRTRFTFNGQETAYIRDTERILDKIGVKHSIYRSKKGNAVHVKVSSNLFGWLLRDVLGCGVRSEDACVPGILMEAPKPTRESLVAGLLRGDGDVYVTQGEREYNKRGHTYRHRMNTASVGFFSSSPMLFQQITVLLQGLGFYPTFRRDKPYMRLYGEEQLARLIPFFDGRPREKLEDYQRGRSKPMAVTQHERHEGFATVNVRALHTANAGEVYSPEVAGTHAFVTSFGLVTHNCIPIDPFYLTWKAREYDFHTRFIELAGEINLAMPVFVREKVIRALNDQGKSVKGARILVLGLAYKEDVADWRESPAFDVIRLLEEYGATVLPHDPLLPEIHDRHEGINIRSIELTDEVIASADCVVIVTHHSAYDYQHIVDLAQAVVDTRNATKNLTRGREKVMVL